MVPSYYTLIQGHTATGKTFLCRRIISTALNNAYFICQNSHIFVFSDTPAYDDLVTKETGECLTVCNGESADSDTMNVTAADIKEIVALNYIQTMRNSDFCLVIIDSVSITNKEEVMAMLDLIDGYKKSRLFCVFVSQNCDDSAEHSPKSSELFDCIIHPRFGKDDKRFYRFFNLYIYRCYSNKRCIGNDVEHIITDPKGEVHQSKEFTNTDTGTKPMKTLLVSIEKQNSDIPISSMSGEFLDIDANNLFSGFVEYLNDKTQKLPKEPKANLADFYLIPETATVIMILHGPMGDFTYDAELTLKESEDCFNYMTDLMTANIDSPDLLEKDCETDDNVDTSKCCDTCAGKKWCNPGKWCPDGTNACANITNCWLSPKNKVVAIGVINNQTIHDFCKKKQFEFFDEREEVTFEFLIFDLLSVQHCFWNYNDPKSDGIVLRPILPNEHYSEIKKSFEDEKEEILEKARIEFLRERKSGG